MLAARRVTRRSKLSLCSCVALTAFDGLARTCFTILSDGVERDRSADDKFDKWVLLARAVVLGAWDLSGGEDHVYWLHGSVKYRSI